MDSQSPGVSNAPADDTLVPLSPPDASRAATTTAMTTAMATGMSHIAVRRRDRDDGSAAGACGGAARGGDAGGPGGGPAGGTPWTAWVSPTPLDGGWLARSGRNSLIETKSDFSWVTGTRSAGATGWLTGVSRGVL